MFRAKYAEQVNHFVTEEVVSLGMPEIDDMKKCTTSPIYKQNYGSDPLVSSVRVRNG